MADTDQQDDAVVEEQPGEILALDALKEVMVHVRKTDHD